MSAFMKPRKRPAYEEGPDPRNASEDAVFDDALFAKFPHADLGWKETNPKDAVGVRRWRHISSVPFTVLAELGVAMLEGARKYGRHNYRVAGIRASVYVDAAFWHIGQWWEGEDIDADSKLSHVTKAIASLVVIRDAMIQGKMVDDRPPKAKLDGLRDELQAVVDELFERHPVPKDPFTQTGEK